MRSSLPGLLALCSLLIVSNAAAQVYKWTDEAGHVHYGDYPPDSKVAKPLAEVAPGYAAGKDVEVEETEFVYFEISGYSAEQLRSEQELHGITAYAAFSNRPYKAWGQCLWRVHWDVNRTMKGDGQCHINNLKLKLRHTITLGKWVTRADGPPDLQKKWDAFSATLKNHELAHKQNSVRAVNDWSTELHNLPPQKDCATVDEKVRASYQRLQAKVKALDNALDQAHENNNEERFSLR